MGRYITQPALKHRVKKQQVFTVSGIFTPSQALLDAGGAVTVRCVGGGGSSYPTYYGNKSYIYGAAGSSGMDITRIVTVTEPVTVTIGAGGAITKIWGSNRYIYTPNDGGTTAFGDLVIALGGKKGEGNSPGGSSGEGSLPSSGGAGGGAGGARGENAPANSGGGGAANLYELPTHGQGGSGLCIVTWEV